MANVRADAVDILYVGELELPLVDISHIEPPPRTLTLEGQEYVFERSVPLKGYGAILGKATNELVAGGKDLLIGRWGMRYYVYTAPASRQAS
jgi:hypothetical protein